MNNNNYFSVAYKILDYLKYCYEHGQSPDATILACNTFNISNRQFLLTLQMLTDDGYIKGLTINTTVSGGRVIGGLNNCYATSAGLQYLFENSMMKRAYKTFKEVDSWLPVIE